VCRSAPPPPARRVVWHIPPTPSTQAQHALSHQEGVSTLAHGVVDLQQSFAGVVAGVGLTLHIVGQQGGTRPVAGAAVVHRQPVLRSRRQQEERQARNKKTVQNSERARAGGTADCRRRALARGKHKRRQGTIPQCPVPVGWRTPSCVHSLDALHSKEQQKGEGDGHNSGHDDQRRHIHVVMDQRSLRLRLGCAGNHGDGKLG
jgi:hypothetical protein